MDEDVAERIENALYKYAVAYFTASIRSVSSDADYLIYESLLHNCLPSGEAV